MYDLLAVELTSANAEDATLVSDLSELTQNQLCLLDELTSDITLVVGSWKLWDIELLEDLKTYEPDDYERLKQDLYVAVEEEKRCNRLDLSWSWAYVASLFRYGERMEPPSITESVGGQCRINIFSGEPLGADGKCWTERYQEPDSVLEISERLSVLNDYDIRQRFELTG